jgi:hypothetical protein
MRHVGIIKSGGVGILVCLFSGCSSTEPIARAPQKMDQRVSASSLVMPSAQTLEVLGPQGLISDEMHVMNTRKDTLLGADLPPVAVPVNLSQVYIRDQQWILNGRPWENYMQTTRSLQLKSR